MFEQNKGHKILRIGFDIDDILLKSAARSIELYNEAYGTRLTLDDWYDFADPKKYAPVWGSDDDALLVKRVVATMVDERFATVEPVDGSQEGVRHLSEEGHELFAITGRSGSLRSQTIDLLDKNFNGVFADDRVFFVDHFQHDGKSMSKADIGLELQLTHFAEDLPAHVNNMARVGIKTALLNPGKYKWSTTGIDPAVAHNVIELGSWPEFTEWIDAEAA